MDIQNLIKIYESSSGSIINYYAIPSKELDNVVMNYLLSDNFDKLKNHLLEYFKQGNKIDSIWLKYKSNNFPIIFEDCAYYKCKLLDIFIRHYLTSESRIRFMLHVDQCYGQNSYLIPLYKGLRRVLHIYNIPGCRSAIIKIMRDYPQYIGLMLSYQEIIICDNLAGIELYCELHSYDNTNPFYTRIINQLLNISHMRLSDDTKCISYEQENSEIKRVYTKYNLGQYELCNELANEILENLLGEKHYMRIHYVYPHIKELHMPKWTLYSQLLNCDLQEIKQGALDFIYPLDEEELLEVFIRELIFKPVNPGANTYIKACNMISKSDRVKPFDIQTFMKLYRLKCPKPIKYPCIYELYMSNFDITLPANIVRRSRKQLQATIMGKRCGVRSLFKLSNKCLDWKISFVSMITYTGNLDNLAKLLF